MAGPIALREQTAGRLLRRLGEIPGGAGVRGSGAGGSPRVLVRCTDATAAAGSGVGAECYPGVVVQPQSGLALADQDADTGEVWLTVLDGIGPGEPAEGGMYWCILAGPVEAGGETRPRAFGPGPGAVYWGVSTSGPVTLPAAGTYILWARIAVHCSVTDAGALDGATVTIKLHNVTTGADIPDTDTAAGLGNSTTGAGETIKADVSLSTFGIVEVDGPTDISCPVSEIETGGGVVTGAASVLWYARIAGPSAGATGGFSGTIGGA